MAATDYKNYTYFRDNDTTHPVRLDVASGAAQPTTANLDEFESDISALVSANRNLLGLHARFVNLTRNVATGNNAGNKYTKLVILTPSDFAGLSKGATVTISGTAWKITGKSPEFAK